MDTRRRQRRRPDHVLDDGERVERQRPATCSGCAPTTARSPTTGGGSSSPPTAPATAGSSTTSPSRATCAASCPARCRRAGATPAVVPGSTPCGRRRWPPAPTPWRRTATQLGGYATTCDTQTCQVYGGAARRASATAATASGGDVRERQRHVRVRQHQPGDRRDGRPRPALVERRHRVHGVLGVERAAHCRRHVPGDQRPVRRRAAEPQPPLDPHHRRRSRRRGLRARHVDGGDQRGRPGDAVRRRVGQPPPAHRHRRHGGRQQPELPHAPTGCRRTGSPSAPWSAGSWRRLRCG